MQVTVNNWLTGTVDFRTRGRLNVETTGNRPVVRLVIAVGSESEGAVKPLTLSDARDVFGVFYEAPGKSGTYSQRVTATDICGATYTVDGPVLLVRNPPTTPPSTKHTLRITSHAQSTSNPSRPGEPVTLSVGVEDSFGHPLRYLWSVVCTEGPSGVLQPSVSVPAPVWTPLGRVCLVRVLIVDDTPGFDGSVESSFVQAVK